MRNVGKKRHKQWLKKKLTNMKEQLLITLKKGYTHRTMGSIKKITLQLKEYKRNEVIAEYRNNTMHISYRLHEHYDMVANVRYIGYIEDLHITTDDVTQHIKETKSAEPDGIKPDLLKIRRNVTHCISILTDTMNKIIQKKTTYQHPEIHPRTY